MKLNSRRNKHGKKKALITLLVFVLFLSVLTIILYSRFWAKTQTFISPIALSSQNVTKTLGELLLDSEIEFSFVTFRSPSSYLVKLKEDGEAILSLEKDFKKQIASLQAVLKQLTIEGKRLIRIDFRFEKPVITLHE